MCVYGFLSIMENKIKPNQKYISLALLGMELSLEFNLFSPVAMAFSRILLAQGIFAKCDLCFDKMDG